MLGVYAAAAPAMPLVGATFQGTVPVVDTGGSISMVTAKWLVSAGSASGKYKLAAKVAGRQVVSELESTAVQGMIAAAAAAVAATAPPAPTTDAPVDSNDYPLTHAFSDNFVACVGGFMGARMLIRLAILSRCAWRRRRSHLGRRCSPSTPPTLLCEQLLLFIPLGQGIQVSHNNCWTR